MAKGRMINRSVSLSLKVADLKTESARVMFLMAIAHLDVEGRIEGHPAQFRGKVTPLLPYSIEDVESGIQDIIRVGLATRYTDARGQQVLQFPGFADEQQGLRKDREAPSKFGAPPAVAISTPANSGVGQESSRTNPEQSGASPAIAGLNEGKSNQEKGREAPRADARSSGCATTTDSESDENPAIAAITVELRTHTSLAFLAFTQAPQRYASHCREHGFTGRKTLQEVLQAIRDAATKVDVLTEAGEVLENGRIASLVAGFVKAEKRKPTETPCPASKDPQAPSWLEREGIPALSSNQGADVALMLDHYAAKGTTFANWGPKWSEWHANPERQHPSGPAPGHKPKRQRDDTAAPPPATVEQNREALAKLRGSL